MLGRGASTARWLGLLAGLLVTAPVDADTFLYEDETGAVYYTNVPSDPRYRKLPGADGSSRTFSPAPAVTGGAPARGPLAFAELIRATADRYQVDPRLVEAVVIVESAGNPRAVSRKGAQGLMQLMPQRSAELGVRNPFDPQENVDGGVRHLRDLLQRFSGNVTLAVAAYNAGEEAVRTYQGVPPYPETQDYVRRVRALHTGIEGPGAPWVINRTPQYVYRQVAKDGAVMYTNVPLLPAPTLRRGF